MLSPLSSEDNTVTPVTNIKKPSIYQRCLLGLQLLRCGTPPKNWASEANDLNQLLCSLLKYMISYFKQERMFWCIGRGAVIHGDLMAGYQLLFGRDYSRSI